MGRVIRLQASDVDEFIDGSRIQPGTLEHLYPDTAVQGLTLEPGPAQPEARTSRRPHRCGT